MYNRLDSIPACDGRTDGGAYCDGTQWFFCKPLFTSEMLDVKIKEKEKNKKKLN